MANRILRDKLQQRWIPKVIPAFEDDVLMHKLRMLIQLRAQNTYIACIQKFYRTTKCCIFNPLLVRQIQPIYERWFFNVRFNRAQLGNPYSRAIVSCASLRLS